MNTLIKKTRWLIVFFSSQLLAANFYLPKEGDALLGTPEQPHYIVSGDDEDLIDIAFKYGVGQNEIVKVNPKVDRWLARAGRKIRIPNSYLLPDTTRTGIVLNLPEFRMYFYPSSNNEWAGQVVTHPISIGRVDWNTPLGNTKITAKIKNPTWTPPASIRREHAAQGDILPDVVPAGPDNPLGLFAMRLGVPGYLIHSTNKPLGLGMRVSHGCVRMYPRDIERLFPFIDVGTPVHIVNQPIKVGWSNGALYIEVHPDLEDKQRSYQERLDSALALIYKANNGQMLNVSGGVLKTALERSDGIPVAIYNSSMNVPEPEVYITNSDELKETQSFIPKPPQSLPVVPETSRAIPSLPKIPQASTAPIEETMPKAEVYAIPSEPNYVPPALEPSTSESNQYPSSNLNSSVNTMKKEEAPMYPPQLENTLPSYTPSTPANNMPSVIDTQQQPQNSHTKPSYYEEYKRELESEEREFKNSPFPY